jgi:hypothetical protein
LASDRENSSSLPVRSTFFGPFAQIMIVVALLELADCNAQLDGFKHDSYVSSSMAREICRR